MRWKHIARNHYGYTGWRACLGIVALALALTLVGCGPVLGSSENGSGNGSDDNRGDIEALTSVDIWIMDEADAGQYSIAGVQRTEDKLRVRADGTAEIWGARGLWQPLTWEEQEEGTIELSTLLETYSRQTPGSWIMEYDVVDGSVLDVRHYGTLEDGSPWEAERSYTAGSLETPLIYEEDFEDGSARFYQGSEWSVIDDGDNKVFAPTSTGDGRSDAQIDVIAGEDFLLTARFKLVGDEAVDSRPDLWLGLVHNSDGSSDAPSRRRPIVTLRDLGAIRVDPEEDRPGDEVVVPVEALEWGRWHDLELRVTDATSYQLLVDGTPVGSATADRDAEGAVLDDIYTYVEGIKLEGNPNDEIWYIDDLRIEYPKVPATASAPLSDGEILYFERLPGERWSLGAMEPDGSGVRGIFFTDHSMWKASPIPGTERIAFSATVDANLDVYTVKADGSERSRLTSDANRDWGAVATPDGTALIFQSDRDGSDTDVYDIFTMGVDGSGPTNLTNTPDAVEGVMEVSPDGTKIAYAYRDGVSGDSDELRVMNLDGTGAVTLMDTAFFAAENDARINRLAWHPDRTHLIIAVDGDTDRYNSSSTALYRVPADTADAPYGEADTEVTELISSTESEAYYDPAYSPDGTKILYHQGSVLHLMNSDGTGATALRDLSGLEGRFTWNGIWVSRDDDGRFR